MWEEYVMEEQKEVDRDLWQSSTQMAVMLGENDMVVVGRGERWQDQVVASP